MTNSLSKIIESGYEFGENVMNGKMDRQLYQYFRDRGLDCELSSRLCDAALVYLNKQLAKHPESEKY